MDDNIIVDFIFLEGICTRINKVKAGGLVVKHKHDYDHLSFLAKGRARVITSDGTANSYEAGSYIIIRANIEHQIEAVTDIEWLCVHATSVAEKDMGIKNVK